MKATIPAKYKESYTPNVNWIKLKALPEEMIRLTSRSITIHRGSTHFISAHYESENKNTVRTVQRL